MLGGKREEQNICRQASDTALEGLCGLTYRYVEATTGDCVGVMYTVLLASRLTRG